MPTVHQCMLVAPVVQAPDSYLPHLQIGGGTLVLQGALWRDTVYDIAANRFLTIRSGACLVHCYLAIGLRRRPFRACTHLIEWWGWSDLLPADA